MPCAPGLFGTIAHSAVSPALCALTSVPVVAVSFLSVILWGDAGSLLALAVGGIGALALTYRLSFERRRLNGGITGAIGRLLAGVPAFLGVFVLAELIWALTTPNPSPEHGPSTPSLVFPLLTVGLVLVPTVLPRPKNWPPPLRFAAEGALLLIYLVSTWACFIALTEVLYHWLRMEMIKGAFGM